MSRHHLWFPQKWYTTEVEKLFRNLNCQVIELDERAHALLHAYGFPPRKPKRDEMLAAINRHTDGECSCGRL